MFIKYPSDNSFSFDNDEKKAEKEFYTFDESARKIEDDDESRKGVLGYISPTSNTMKKIIKPHDYHHKPKCPHCNKIYSTEKPCTYCGFYGGNHDIPKYKLKEDVTYKYKDRCPCCKAPYTPKEPCFYCGYYIGKPIFYPFNKIIPNSLYTEKEKYKNEDKDEDRDFSHIEGSKDDERNEPKVTYNNTTSKNQKKDVMPLKTSKEIDSLETSIIKKMKEKYGKEIKYEDNIGKKNNICESCTKIEAKAEEEKIIKKGVEKEKNKIILKNVEKTPMEPIVIKKITMEPKKEKPVIIEKIPKEIEPKKTTMKIEVEEMDVIEIKGSIEPIKDEEIFEKNKCNQELFQSIDEEFYLDNTDSCSEEKIEGKSKNKDKKKNKYKDKHKDKGKSKDKECRSKRKKR